MKPVHAAAWLIAGAALSGGAIALAPISGELDPPSEVEPTTPSLADLSQQIAQLSAGSTGDTPADGWEVLFVSPRDIGADQRIAIEVAPGRVLLHKLIVYRSAATAFDGPGGSIDTNSRPVTGLENAIANAQMLYVAAGGAQLTSTEVTFDIVAEDGLWLAYEMFESQGIVQVHYARLD